MKYMKRSEDTEQICLMDWASSAVCRFPELRWLYHIPNGGTRNMQEAVKLKRMGVKSGVSDIHLPFPHGKYHGLYIEMKYGRNTATQEQVEFMCDMKEAGHFVAVYHDAQSAISLIEQYINLSSRGRIAVCELENKNVYWDDDGICHIKSV